MTSGLKLERPARLQHLHDARPDRRRADARAGLRAGHVLRVRAERGVAARRDRRPLRRAGHAVVRPAPAHGPARHRGAHLGLDARPGRPRRRLLRREDAPRRLRSARRAHAPRRRVARQAAAARASSWTRAVAPSRTNGCYGWLIWVNAGKPCVGPRISERPVEPTVDFPTMPRDMYRFVGLFGQLVDGLPVAGDRRRPHRPGPAGCTARRRRHLGAGPVRPGARRDPRHARSTGPTGDEPAPVARRAEPRPGLPERARRARPVLQGRRAGPAAARRPAARPRAALRARPRRGCPGRARSSCACSARRGPRARATAARRCPRTRSSKAYSVPARRLAARALHAHQPQPPRRARQAPDAAERS